MKKFIALLLAAVMIFAFAGVVGMLRMPDSFCRMQSSTNIATLGVLGVIIAGVLYAAFYLHDGAMAVKLVFMGIFYIITNPIAGHAICRGGYKHGVRPTKEYEVDKYGEDMVEE